jgi:asparagine synthase (glutamine-hydrolysing)
VAHLAIVIDEDGARRTAFVRRARSLFADLPGAIVADATVGSLACVWAHGPRAPVSIARCGDTFAILIGYAIDDDGRWITAADLAGRWLGQESAAGVFDGYHVAAAYDTVRGLAAAVDPCGMFPLHHAKCGEAALVATTPEAFRCHDAFTERVDREGLAGILLVNGPLQDRPLVAGESRLPRGHRLSWSHGGGLATKAVHRSAGTPPPAGETPADAVRRIDHELIRAIRRHRPVGVPTSLMLSGGLDSRLVAGCLADEGISVRAVTLGGPDDFEVVAGRAVAERLGMPHVVVSQETGGDEFVAHVRRAVRFTHLTAGPTGDDLGLGLGLSGTPDPFFWSGIAFDWVFEPISASDGLDTATGTWSFERLLSVMNRMGVAPQDLAALLGSDGAELLAAVIDRLRAACLSGPDEPATAAALHRWDQRCRNHVGTSLHQTTFTSWPLVPATDRRFFSAVFGLPVAVHARRRLEKAVFAARRPDLAAIPLDANSFRFEPIGGARATAGPVGRLAAAVRKRLRQAYWRGVRGYDPRRYGRLFQVDHPRWVAVRRAADPLRPRLHGMLDAATLARVFPPPLVRVSHDDPVAGGSVIRLLAGLALWCDRPPA